MSVPKKAVAQTGLCSVIDTNGSVQLNYNQRPAGRQVEIVSSEGTGWRT